MAMKALIGISMTITATPANTDGPRVFHKKYIHTHIWKGADHNILRYVVRSMKRWASTDIKLTI